MSRDVARLTSRLCREHCPPLGPGQEFWVETRYLLTARLRRSEARGEILVLRTTQLAPGVFGAVVQRLKPRRPAWQPSIRSVVVLSLAAVTSLSMVRFAGPFLLAALIMAFCGALFGALRCGTGHRPACVGLHCPGCQR